MNFRNSLAYSLALLISLVISFGLFTVDSFAQSNDGSTPSLESVLDENGRVKPGISGSFDPRGFQLTHGPNGEPRFLKALGHPAETQKVGLATTEESNPDGRWDSRFFPVGISRVEAMTVSGSDIYIGGSFTTVGGDAINRVAKWNGTFWSALGSGVNNSSNSAVVTAIAVLGTDVFVAGDFTTAGEIQANGIARWDGTSWSALGSGVNGLVRTLDGSGSVLYVGGEFTIAGGIAVNYIAKWDGTSWSALGTGFDGQVNAVAVAGSDVYAGGSFTNAGETSVNRIAKWNGSVWQPLGSGISGGGVGAIAPMGSEILVGGNFSSAGGITTRSIAKWNGASWSALGGGVDGSVSSIASNGVDVFVVGNFPTAGGVTVGNIAKWNGTVWSSLNGGAPDDSPSEAVILGNDLYVAGGDLDQVGGLRANGIAKWDGTSWIAIGQGALGTLWAVAASSKELFVGGGGTGAFGGVPISHVARWNGNEWSPLGSGTNNGIFALTVSGSDLYVGGYFTEAGGVSASRIAKWNGSSWSALGSGLSGTVWAIAVSGTDVYAGGQFTSAGGVSASNIAKWNGSTWSSLGSGTNDVVRAIAIKGSDVFVGGLFTNAGGVSVNRIARWDGIAWNTLGSGLNSPVLALAVSGSNLFVGGGFTSAGGITANRIAKWNGQSWSALGTGLNNSENNAYVQSIAVVGSNHLVVGGGFTQAGDVTANHIAKWDGESWSSYGLGPDNVIKGLATIGRDVYLVGDFGRVGSFQSPAFARWFGDSFVGNTDSNWHSAANWESKAIPESSSNVVITLGTASIIEQDAFVRDLQVNTGASLFIDQGRKLYVYGSKEIRGSLSGSGEIVSCGVEINPTRNSVTPAAGNGTVQITTTSGCPWTAISDSPFLKTSSSGAGNGTINYSYPTHSANAGGTPRAGTLTVGGKIFTLEQAGCSVTLASTGALGLSSNGASGSVSVSAATNCSWEVESDSSWLTVIPIQSGGTGNGTAGFNVEANIGSVRSGVLSIGGKSFAVTQESGCTFTLGSSSSAIGAEGATGSITVDSSDSGCGWTATSGASWVTVTSGSTGSGNGSVGYTVASNNGPERIGNITVAGQTFTINQASGCTQTLSSAGTDIASAGGTGSVNVTSSNSGCTWEIRSDSQWLTVTSGSSGTGNESVSFNASTNVGPIRTGNLSIGDKSLAVTQASGCALTLSSSAGSGAADGGAGSFDITTAVGCSWSVQSGSPWLQITSGPTGVGSGRVDFIYSENMGSTRTTIVMVNNLQYRFTQAAASSCVTVSVGNFEVATLSSLSVPVTVSDLSGRAVESFDIELFVDNNVLRLASSPTDLEGVIAEDWSVIANSPSPGLIRISGFGTTPLSGSGALLKLRFDVIGDRGTKSDIRFGAFTFNNDVPCSGTTGGSVSVLETGDVSGSVNFFFTPQGLGSKPIRGVTLVANGTPNVSASTNESGAYLIEGMGVGAYTVTPSKTDEINGVSSFDAASVAQHLVGLITLTPNQLLAADVTNDGVVSSFDASRIAQWTVGIAPSSGQNIAGTWKFTPLSRNYTSVTESLTGQDFTAILMGDVTGNWVAAPSLGSLGSLESLESRKSDQEDVAKAIGFGLSEGEVRIPGIRSSWSDSLREKSCVESRSKLLNVTNENVGKTSLPADNCLLSTDLLEIPVSIGSANGVLAYDAVITYDADIVEPVIERPVESNGTLSTNFNVVVNRSEPGKLRLAAYGIAPVTGDGDLIVLRFRVKKPNAKIDDAKLEFESLVINEKSVISRQWSVISRQ